MAFFFTLTFFSLIIYLLIKLIGYLMIKFLQKEINEVNEMDIFAGSLTSSFGFLIYSHSQDSLININNIQSISDFISLVRILFIGLLTGGFILLSIASLSTIFFGFFRDRYVRIYNIQESLIFKVYSSMFLMSAFTFTALMLFVIYIRG
jgi:hypothetical protein